MTMNDTVLVKDIKVGDELLVGVGPDMQTWQVTAISEPYDRGVVHTGLFREARTVVTHRDMTTKNLYSGEVLTVPRPLGLAFKRAQ